MILYSCICASFDNYFEGYFAFVFVLTLMNISVHVLQLTGSKKGRVPLGGAAQSSGFGLNSHFHPLVFILSWFTRCILILSFSFCLSIYQSVCWLSNSDSPYPILTCYSKVQSNCVNVWRNDFSVFGRCSCFLPAVWTFLNSILTTASDQLSWCIFPEIHESWETSI